MSRIKLLPEEVACQVAAGEVVERPASVVKELVENSIDAGAKKIEIAVQRGGIALVRVVDDGIGMDRDDALMCLERHATSKIRTATDLAAIATLGFRGEALPSIASVSRFRLCTRETKALAGTEVIVSGGKIETVRDSGEAPGTQVEVRSLFYNLPARKKFLRTENTELSHVEHQLQLQALGHPEIAFVFVSDGKVIWQLPPAANLRDRVRDLCGAQLENELLEIPAEDFGGVKIRGLIGKAGVSRSSRAQQFVFINGRAVENGTINFALREGYHTALMKGQHPVTFLFIDMDPAAVDVNVHPAKREVRFRDGASVREAVVEAVRRALESDRANWSKTFVRPETTKSILPVETPPLIEPREQTALRRDWSSLPLQTPREAIPHAEKTSGEACASTTARAGFFPGKKQPADESNPARPEEIENRKPGETARQGATGQSEIENFRILGVLGKLYVLMENETGLVLVDQHAAHERILFEELRRRMEALDVPSQRLLMPLTIQVTPRDADWIAQNSATLHKMGIGIEPFGAGTFKIDALPQFLRAREPLQLIRDVIDELRETSATTSKLRLGEDVIAKTVCRHAVKANDFLREPELVRLIQDLLACELPYCCPHGRPTMIQISYGELEKKFGRRV